MPSFNCSSSLETQVLLYNVCTFRLLLQFIRGTFQQKALAFFVLAVCETSCARGLKQMQRATDQSWAVASF